MSTQKKLTIHEDWVVVILGGLIILLAFIGLVLPVPSFSWKTGSELATTVFSSTNLGTIGLQFLLVFVISALGAFLTGKSVGANLKTFPVVYILTIIALVLAGNAQVKALNLEAVIFSLTIGLIIGNFFKLPEWF
ncbi:MAG TPA: putative sulfate exporter family transporter, partial [Pedobacter sp.]